VYLELRKLYKEVFHWRDTHEVDFIVQTQKGLQPIQVSYQGDTPRSIKGADAFYQAFPRALPAVTVHRENAEGFMGLLA
jgi:predicted AAA+ superfamily ATPase